MDITFAPNGILQIDDARIVYRNFKGAGTKFNREGNRNFSLIIDSEELANELTSHGWNIKTKDAREEGDIPFMTLPIKIKYSSGRGPAVYLRVGDRVIELDEESIGTIDDIAIEKVDLDIRPYEWEVNGKTGITAYLHSMEVTQKVDRFAARRLY